MTEQIKTPPLEMGGSHTADGMVKQRLAASEWLERHRVGGDDPNRQGDGIYHAFLVIPRGWQSEKPSSDVIAALEAVGFVLDWIPMTDGAPAMILLPRALLGSGAGCQADGVSLL